MRVFLTILVIVLLVVAATSEGIQRLLQRMLGSRPQRDREQ
jgi:hypothetical protein